MFALNFYNLHIVDFAVVHFLHYIHFLILPFRLLRAAYVTIAFIPLPIFPLPFFTFQPDHVDEYLG